MTDIDKADLERQKKLFDIQEKKMKNRTIWVTTLIPLLTIIISVITSKITAQNEMDKTKLSYTQERITALIDENDIIKSRKKIKFLTESDLIGTKENKTKIVNSLNSNLIDESESRTKFFQGVLKFNKAYNSNSLDTLSNYYFESIKLFYQSLELNPNNYEARSYLASSYNNLGLELSLNTFYEKAVEEYDKTIQIDSSLNYVYLDKAKTLENLNRDLELCITLTKINDTVSMDTTRRKEYHELKEKYCNK